MHDSRKARSRPKRTRGVLGPGADAAFAHLLSPQLKRRVLVAHLTDRTKSSVQQYIGRPLGRIFLRRWMAGRRDAHHVEKFGLPGHVVEEVLGKDALTLYVDPRKLVRLAIHAPRREEKRPSSLAFIWDGTWDQRRYDLRTGSRYRLISELDEHRGRLDQTERFRELMDELETGKPWESHQLGVVLDSPERIIAYLQVYLDFLDDMAVNGFDATRGKDSLEVAISRTGTILKIDRGLHRLAMAQRLGLPSVPVYVRHVHRLWWNEVTRGTTGKAALLRMQEALQHCVPEVEPGPLDYDPPIQFPDDFWPPARVRNDFEG